MKKTYKYHKKSQEIINHENEKNIQISQKITRKHESQKNQKQNQKNDKS